MKTNRLFLALTFAFALGASNVFAQPEPGNENRPEERQRKRPTPEQLMDFHVKQMESKLMLDEKTAAKFSPLYKEYLEAMKECRQPIERGKDIKKGERTDKEIMDELEGRLDRQQKVLDTKKKYFNSFKKILTPRQLEKVFAPAPGKFGPKAWQGPKAHWKNNKRGHYPLHHRGCGPHACPHCHE